MSSLGKTPPCSRQDVRDSADRNQEALSLLYESLNGLTGAVATKEDIDGLHQRVTFIQEMLHAHLSAVPPLHALDLPCAGILEGFRTPSASLADELERTGDALGSKVLTSASVEWEGSDTGVHDPFISSPPGSRTVKSLTSGSSDIAQLFIGQTGDSAGNETNG